MWSVGSLCFISVAQDFVRSTVSASRPAGHEIEQKSLPLRLRRLKYSTRLLRAGRRIFPLPLEDDHDVEFTDTKATLALFASAVRV